MAQTFLLDKEHDPDLRARIRQNLLEAIVALDPSQSWRVEIKRAVKERTDKQLGATFGLAYKVIMEATGLEGDEDKRQLHHDFCGDFFGWVDAGLGRRKPARTTTTNEAGERDVIDTETMARFYDFIQRRAAEFGIVVPDPDPLFHVRKRWA